MKIKQTISVSLMSLITIVSAAALTIPSPPPVPHIPNTQPVLTHVKQAENLPVKVSTPVYAYALPVQNKKAAERLVKQIQLKNVAAFIRIVGNDQYQAVVGPVLNKQHLQQMLDHLVKLLPQGGKLIQFENLSEFGHAS